MTIRPPFLDVFPDGMARIATIPIPPLIPRTGAYNLSTPSVEVTPTKVHYHPFLSLPPRIARLVPLNRWQPVEVRPNIDILVPVNGDLDYIIHLPSPESARAQTASSLPSPRWAPQARELFEPISLSSINLVRLPKPGGHADAVVCELVPDMGAVEMRVHAFPQNADGSFSPHFSSRSFNIDVQKLGWSYYKIAVLPLCPVSGSVLLTHMPIRGHLYPADGVVIAVASFD